MTCDSICLMLVNGTMELAVEMMHQVTWIAMSALNGVLFSRGVAVLLRTFKKRKRMVSVVRATLWVVNSNSPGSGISDSLGAKTTTNVKKGRAFSRFFVNASVMRQATTRTSMITINTIASLACSLRQPTVKRELGFHCPARVSR